MAITEEILNGFKIGDRWVIEANAGTGKTYTLEQIVAAAILNGTVEAEKILLVTFTVKAATELRARVRSRLLKLLKSAELDEQKRRNLEKALDLPDSLWSIQTIHGFCKSALLEFSIFSGCAPLFRLVDERALVERAVERALRTSWLIDNGNELLPAIQDLFAAEYQLSKAVEKLVDAWCAGLRVDGDERKFVRAVACFIGRSGEKDGPDIKAMNRFVALALRELPRFMEGIMQEEGLMTFNSLISDLHAALHRGDEKSRSLVASIRDKFQVCIVDEFQDTDALQWEIFRKAFCESKEHAFVCVGDSKQSIYAFRGADLATYRSALTYLQGAGAARFVLDKNWRSSSSMVQAVNEILSNGEFSSLDYNSRSTAAREAVGIWFDEEMKNSLPPVRIIAVPLNPKGMPKAKAKRCVPYQIAKEIAKLMSNPPWIRTGDDEVPRQLEWSDILVLTSGRSFLKSAYPTGDQSEVSAAMNHLGIPHWIYRHENLFRTAEVQSLLDVMRAAMAPEEHLLRNRAMLSPLLCGRYPQWGTASEVVFGFGDAARRDAERFLGEIGILLLNRKYNGVLLACRSRLATLLELPDWVRGNLETALERICETGTTEGLNPWQLTAQMHRWVEEGDDGESESVEGETKTGNIQGARNTRNAVTIMTWHSAKGCEAPVVFVTGGFWDFSPDASEMRPRLALKKSTGEVVATYGDSLKDDGNFEAHDRDENSRLQYVVLTRACVLLYLPVLKNTKAINKSARWKPSNSAIERWIQNKRNVEQIETVRLDENDPYPAKDKVARLAVRQDLRFVAPLEKENIPALCGVLMSSYSSMKKKAGFSSMGTSSYELVSADGQGRTEPVEIQGDEPSLRVEDSLESVGGKDFGLFIHSLYEETRWDELREGPDSQRFQQEIDRVLKMNEFEIFSRFGADAIGGIRQTLLTSITTPICVEGVIDMPFGIWQADKIICEVEFHLPDVCAKSDDSPAGSRSQERFFKGFIDVVFSHNGRTFFADWKTDRLDESQLLDLAAVMEKLDYDLQLQLYSKALFRALNGNVNPGFAWNSFGGGVYLFVRYGANGVYARRPSLEEVQAPLRMKSEIRNPADAPSTMQVPT